MSSIISTEYYVNLVVNYVVNQGRIHVWFESAPAPSFDR